MSSGLWRVVVLCCLLISGVPSKLADAEEPRRPSAPERPYAYLFPAELYGLTEHLQRRDIQVDELREDIELEIEAYRIEQVVCRERADGKGPLFRFETKSGKESRRFEAGTILVRTEQESTDRLVRLLDPRVKKGARLRSLLPALREGDEYPIVRLDSYVPITHGRVRPLADTRQLNKPITFETVYGEHRVHFSGSPVSDLTWLEDGEHYLQARDGRLYKVHAASGRSALFIDPNRLAEGLKKLPTMRTKDAESLSRGTRFEMNPDHSAILIDYDNDLYYGTTDGSKAVRLTSSPGQEKYGTFDPQGRFVAFVRDNNLHVVDIATQTERALTTDGGGTVRNGEADWVYFEEVFDRQWKLFWWSPDSSSIAFYQTDDAPVHEFTVVNNVPERQQVEATPYPRAGDPNPKVRLGIVSAAGGPVKWVDLGEYTEGAYLVTGAGWLPDSEKIYFFVQDRAQTWLDVDTAPRDGGKPKRLLRDSTRAWIEPPDTPRFLADGSFLLSSERTGWKHLYLYDKAGALKRAVTEGEWEVRKVHHVDEKNGWVYLTGTRDCPIAEHLYRARLDGGALERLTQAPGQHQVSLSPDGRYYIDRWSNASTPTQVALYATDGTNVRTLDTNPVYERQEYRLGTYEQFQIRMSDGFLLEASLIKPSNFDSGRKYPVWFTTYAGPHSPTICDAWQGGRADDHMLAEMGALVFQCDPRTASGKGACSAWCAYKQLGVQELKDIEEAIRWLKEQSCVDGDRIGMSGYSYGGFMTAYALTHSQLFAGGIAGAPPTDWHLYDTIYTERYMDTPQNNPEGYERTSVVKTAPSLHGQLLILHGAIDDNVHVENTFKLVDALQKADKKFQLMIYPQSRHGIGGMHYDRLCVDFIKMVLQLPDEGGGK
jgi:dipeptidyl aminopeptidase/acylaminoacyl peptidase